jgi:hypothetical protein
LACDVGIDIERRGKLIGDLSHSGLAVTPIPPEKIFYQGASYGRS